MSINTYKYYRTKSKPHFLRVMNTAKNVVLRYTGVTYAMFCALSQPLHDFRHLEDGNNDSLVFNVKKKNYIENKIEN